MMNKRSYLRCLLIMPLLAGAPLLLANAHAAEMEGASFVDRFARLSAARWYVSSGWTNGPHQNCIWAASRTRIGPRGLQLELADLPAKNIPYTCAEIQTLHTYGYGTYETRLRSVAAPGVVTAFFTFIGPSIAAGLPHDEIDFEFLGKDPKSVQLNFFSKGAGGHEHFARFDFNAAETVNDYAFEWLPDRIRWFINGELVHEAQAKPGERFPAQPSKIYLSLWNGIGAAMDPWLGKFVYPGHPLVAMYEYVAFTKLGDRCQFPTSIVCQGKTGAAAP